MMRLLDLFDPNLMDYKPWILVIIGLGILLSWPPSVDMDPAEPPLLKPTVPYIGHAIGFLRHQTKYLSILKYIHASELPLHPI